MPRLFTGIEVPNEVETSLSMLRGGLPGARWIEPENYHITLRFIGDVDDGLAREIASMLGGVRLFGPQNSIIIVDDNSPAVQAGLQRRDQLKEVNGAPIKNQRDLDAIIAAKAPGDTLRLKVARGEEILLFDVKLEGREEMSCQLNFMENPSPLQEQIKEGLLKGNKMAAE